MGSLENATTTNDIPPAVSETHQKQAVSLDPSMTRPTTTTEASTRPKSTHLMRPKPTAPEKTIEGNQEEQATNAASPVTTPSEDSAAASPANSAGSPSTDSQSQQDSVATPTKDSTQSHTIPIVHRPSKKECEAARVDTTSASPPASGLDLSTVLLSP
eukprot:GHVU01172868.1.p1 GENE.GHVU01172868.1~~GHVU01172868.1.p1  ORF type:complete len:158 (-),score=22.80 GHVU01172868.1:950-1423(-)